MSRGVLWLAVLILLALFAFGIPAAFFVALIGGALLGILSYDSGDDKKEP